MLRQLLQLSNRENMDLSIDTYFEILRRKTAVLVGACCRLGAVVSNAPDEVVDAADRFGCGLGVAFQIQDDLLDLLGNRETVGKSTGRDLETGKLTLPVLLYFESASPQQREELCHLLKTRKDAERREKTLER